MSWQLRQLMALLCHHAGGCCAARTPQAPGERVIIFQVHLFEYVTNQQIIKGYQVIPLRADARTGAPWKSAPPGGFVVYWGAEVTDDSIVSRLSQEPDRHHPCTL